MTNHVLLDNVSHKDLRIDAIYQKNNGYDVNVTRVFPMEFSQLQAEYPLFFIKNTDTGHYETVALLGFSDQENLYLGTPGWRASYIPMSIERQPFLIGFQQQFEDGAPFDAPVVHLDVDHPSVSNKQGKAVFLPHGGESPLLERINSILLAIHNGHEVSQVFSQLLVGLELIESLNLEVEFNDGSKQSLQGLYTINDDKLRTLNAHSLELLHQKGHLQDVYMLLAALPNLAKLIERKNTNLANADDAS